ncbi:MAG: porin family protein [bacterium]|nr:porin family protein [bacterium]
MKIRTLIVMVIAAVFLAGAAQAAEERPWYGGVKTGVITLDEPGIGDLTQAGALFGYKFVNRDWGSFAIEAEYSDTVDAGNLSFPGADWEGEMLAGCFVFRGPGKGYLKGKAGYVDVSAEVSAFGLSEDVNDSDYAAGIGFGWKLGKNAALEVEWTRAFFDEDLDFYSIGFNF